MRTAPNPLIDTLKALASQLIVLHHLAFYGPMSDHAYAPDLIDWLYDYARMAVQCFLVIGGYLAAQSLAPSGHITKPKFTLPGLLWKRYLRLALPLFAALGLAIAAAALVRTIHPLPDTPTAPALGQLVAHLLLAQQILGHESLSAGVWYVAIDFQLFALFAALMWLGRHAGRFANFAPLLVLSLTLASLYGFNRQPELDIWAPYFFGAYGLGITVFWLQRSRHFWPGLLLLALITLGALLFEQRPRLALAFGCAMLLAFAARHPAHRPTWAPIALLGRISYSVFLVHYPVCLLVNAAFAHWVAPEPWLQLGGMLLAWWLSLTAGWLFHHYVETWLTRHTTSATIARPHQAHFNT